ncbi:MAG: DUF1836 domain-containing protein [Erysipelotrichaceae bacterium]
MQEINKILDKIYLPRFQELPVETLYMGELLIYLNDTLAFIKDGDDKIITKTMINNYVKSGLISTPIKKKYNNEHIAYLIVITILKHSFSLEETQILINFQKKHVPNVLAYNYFRKDFVHCLRKIINQEEIEHTQATGFNGYPVFLIQLAIELIAGKIFFQLSLKNLDK